MAERFLAAGLAFCLCALLTPTAIDLAGRIGAVDVPRDTRRMHKRPMPRTGGVAIFAAFVIAAGWVGADVPGFARLLTGATVLAVLGVLDDVFRLPAWSKLIIQLLAAAMAVSGGGGLGEINIWGHVVALGRLSLPLSVVWLVVCVNAHNMIDGLDGLSTSVSAVEAFILSVLLALQGSGALSGVALALCGCCLGYLPYNRHPARVFMGDTGSQLLGFVLGYLALAIDQRAAGDLGAFIPVFALAIPLSDLVFAVLRRTARGQSPFAADRGHWHHRLTDAGLSQRQVCFWMMLSITCHLLLCSP
jgi:UDP-GlcNAc:undecaprenyl-phosphate GlcNAc-1-phosphate transferase